MERFWVLLKTRRVFPLRTRSLGGVEGDVIETVVVVHLLGLIEVPTPAPGVSTRGGSFLGSQYKRWGNTLPTTTAFRHSLLRSDLYGTSLL